MSPLVAIVILNWNRPEETLACYASVQRLTYPNYRVVIVDNGSDGGPGAALEALSPAVELIRNTENLGFAGGCNVGIEAAMRDSADYVWLLNADAQTAPDTLGAVVATAEADHGIGLVSPLTCDTLGSTERFATGGIIDRQQLTYDYTERLEVVRDWLERFPQRFAVTGTAMLVRASVIRRIGGLDETLFAYWEDVDYSLRSSLAGYRNVVDFGAVVAHPAKAAQVNPSRVPPRFFYYMARNEILMWKKYGKGRRLARTLLWVFMRQLRQIALMPAYQPGIDAVLAGLWDGWRGVGGRFDPARRMPQPLRFVLGRRPRWVLRALGGSAPIGNQPISGET